MTDSMREPLGGLAFAAALALVGLLLRPAVEVVGAAVLFAGIVVALISLVQIARALSRPAE
jgi:hypothetical protein